MFLPYLKEGTSKSTQRVINFLGLNYSEQFQDGEFSDTKNVTADNFPTISQRRKRVKEGQYIAPSSLYAKAGLFVVDGTRVLYNGEFVGEVTEGEKQMVAVGNILVIFPDKKYYNAETKTFGTMEIEYTAADLVFGTNADGMSTITTSGEDFKFSVGDAITISGCSVAPENNMSIIIRGVEGKVLTFYSNSFTNATETGEVTLKREVPDLDFICENNYRLWGCKDNTIYASKYADPLNFNVFDGITSDSYYIQVGSDGKFTGCASFSSHICFFKEDILHKLYGSKPSNYQLVDARVFGVQEGCSRTLCTINETLYYLGMYGVYAYTGGVPELVSEQFGTKRFLRGCAGSDGEKYYISLKNGESWGLYVYDIRRNIWLKEDDTHVVDFANKEGDLYFIEEGGSLIRVNGSDDASDEVIEWSVTFCPFNEVINERKGYSQLGLRVELDKDAWITVEVRADGGLWETAFVGHNEYASTATIPIKPNRCDSFEVRISGKGRCKVKSLVRKFSIGSEV